MNAKRDPWSVLEVSRKSSPEAVRQAYLRLVRLHHPDRYPANSREQRIHEERMKEVTEAYRAILGQAEPSPDRSSPSSSPAGPPPPRRREVRVDPDSLKCRAHGRWAVIFCRVCAAPLCSRCDTALSGYCRAHRRIR
jgi:hypothetical protein